MSTILKALRRLEDKKADAAQRPLRDEVVVSAVRRKRSGLAPAIAAGVALAFAGIALLWAFDPEGESDAGIAAQGAPAVSAAPEPESEPPPDPYAATVSSEAAFADDATPDFEIVRPDPSAAPRPLTPPPLPRIADERAVPQRAREPRRIAPEFEAQPRYETDEPELPVYEEEPFYAEPERAVAVAKPSASVSVARTQWHPDPGRRVAWVEVAGSVAMREVREGERIGPYLVRQIEPAAVLFSDGAVEVRREVGR